MKNFGKITLLLSFLQLFNSNAYAGIYAPYHWHKTQIKVCFSGPVENAKISEKTKEWNQAHKRLIQDIVEDEYTPDKTIVHFVGFEDCDKSVNPDIVIFNKKGSALKAKLFGGKHGEATVGVTIFRIDKKFPTARGVVYLYDVGMNRAVISHEFGHSAGLFHEHEHPDAARVERSCSSARASTGNNKENGGFRTNKRYFTEYDRESIMNYCHLKRSSTDVGLSIKDQDLLRHIYTPVLEKELNLSE